MYQLKSKSSASFHIIEELIKHRVHGKDLVGAFHNIRIDDLLARSVIIFCTFVPLFAFRDLRRVMGQDNFRTLFFHSKPARNQPGWLFLKDQRRPANALTLEVDPYFDAVRNLDEGNATVHTELLTVERHCPCNAANYINPNDDPSKKR